MQQYSVVFWNVQRLFEASGSPIRAALEDAGSARTSESAVALKVAIIGAVLTRIQERSGPLLLVGLTEVQTASLAKRVADAVSGDRLASVDDTGDDHFDDPLEAINIALLHDREVLGAPCRVRSHIVDRTFETRDILEVGFAGRPARRGSPARSPLSVFVSHWPSRLSPEGGAKRIAAAYYLRRLVSDVVRFPLAELWDPVRGSIKVPAQPRLLEQARRPLLAMGDFNDEPFDNSLDVLRATPDLEVVVDDLKVRGQATADRFRTYVGSVPHLGNPFWSIVGTGEGTYYRSPRWRTYDQILLSRGLLEGVDGAPSFVRTEAYVFRESAVTLPDGMDVPLVNRNGKPRPFDAEGGRGCSDHFPVVVGVEW